MTHNFVKAYSKLQKKKNKQTNHRYKWCTVFTIYKIISYITMGSVKQLYSVILWYKIDGIVYFCIDVYVYCNEINPKLLPQRILRTLCLDYKWKYYCWHDFYSIVLTYVNTLQMKFLFSKTLLSKFIPPYHWGWFPN